MWKGLNSKSCSQEGKEGSLCPLLALTLQAALLQPNHVGMGRKHRCQPHGFILSSFSGHPEAPHLNCLTLGFTISDWGFMSIWFRKGNVIFLKLRVVNFMSLHVSSETHFSPSHSVCTHTHTHTCLGFACGATGVQDEEWVFSITPFRLTLIPCLLHEFMPPQVNPLIPGDLQGAENRNGQRGIVNRSGWGQNSPLPSTWRGQGRSGRWRSWEGGRAQRGWNGAGRTETEPGGFLGTPSTLLQNFSHLASGGGGPLGWSLLGSFLA